MGHTHFAPVDEEVSKALLYNTPDPDFEAVHAAEPNGTATSSSVVELILQRV
jgi:hypothetical protein